MNWLQAYKLPNQNFVHGKFNPLKIIGNYWIILYVLLVILISQLIFRVTVIDNTSAISHVSVIAGLNIWFWYLSIVFLSLIAYFQVKSAKFPLLTNILIALLIIVNSINLAGFQLALSGTPMTFADIRGDLGTYVDLAELAKQTGFSTFTYPPIYVSLIGNLANFFNMQVIELFKNVDSAIVLFAPLILIILYSKFLPKWNAFALVLIISSTTIFGWKNLAFYLIIGQIMYIVEKRNLSNNIRLKLLNNSRGLVLGFFILIYFGHFWWSMITLIIFSFLTIFLKPQYSSYQFSIYLGLFIVLGPYFGQRLTGLNAFYILLLAITFVLFHLKLRNLNRIFTILLPLMLTFVIFNFRTGDTWIQGDVQQPSVGILGDLNYTNLIFILILGIILFFYKFVKEQLNLITLFLTLLLSPMSMMLFFASRMQVTQKVELWPRAQDFIENIFFLFFTIFIIKFVDYIVNNYFLKKVTILQFFLGLVIVLFPVSNTLNSKIFNIFPRYSNGAWFAHQACANPHEDPMLAKVFETKPNIQYFLRFNCQRVEWPYIKIAFNGPNNMLQNPYFRFYTSQNTRFDWNIFPK